MTPKEKRTIERDLETLFSTKAFIIPATIEVWKSLGFFHPQVRTDNGALPLSPVGIAALRRLTGIVQKFPELRDSCSSKEIAEQVHESYEGWIKRLLQPDGQEFVDGVRDALLATVKERIFLVGVEGLDLEDLERLNLGLTTICKADPALLSEIEFGGALTSEWVQSQFASKLWLIGNSQGSPEVSRQQFEHRTVLTVGILAVCGALLFKGAIWQSHVRAVIAPHQQTMAVSVFSWDAGGANPNVSRSWGQDKKLPLNAEAVSYLRKECFLDRLAELLGLKERTEVQDAIVRALYWFADAHADPNTTMRFIKLWSCAECFFAITDQDVTEANARGIATILTFAGYGITTAGEYAKFKRRLKAFYDLRSRAVHRAQFGEVQLQDLEEFSRLIAWLIVSMTALTERGYQTLASIKEQVVRLDRIMGKKPVAIVQN